MLPERAVNHKGARFFLLQALIAREVKSAM